MKAQDDFVKAHAHLLAGSYDCLDRIVLNGYFLPGQNGGGMRQWWERRAANAQEEQFSAHGLALRAAHAALGQRGRGAGARCALW